MELHRISGARYHLRNKRSSSDKETQSQQKCAYLVTTYVVKVSSTSASKPRARPKSQTAKSQLDDAARVVGRQIMVGTVSDGTSVGNAICANIPAFIDCTQVMFDLQPYGIAAIPTIPPGLSYDGSGNVTNVWAVNFGNPGSIMVLRLYYQFPIVGGPFVTLATQQNGTKLLVSTYIFVREG